jgi:hypothetical protein
MAVRFSSSYIERLFATRDLSGLYHLISVTGQERSLPEQLWLFCRLREWAGSTRSGIGQYYESLSDEKFERMNRALRLSELSEIAEKYRAGKSTWDETERAASLDKWIDAHEQQIDDAAFELALSQKEWLNVQD